MHEYTPRTPQKVEATQKNLVRQSLGYNTINQGVQFQKLIEQTLCKLIEEKLYNM